MQVAESVTITVTAGGKKGKKKAKPVPLNDFLSGSKVVVQAPNWADATEDIDPSGEVLKRGLNPADS